VLWFAIENAAEYGGNPSDIRLVGFSGGANNAAAVALYPSTDDTRCQSTANSFKVSQVVAFEGDLTLSPQWDPVLIDDPSFYNEMTVWSHIYGYSGGQIDILVDDKTTIAITSGVRAYLDLRHPEGSIREAWDELGVIEEDYATLIQANEMFHSQLIAADKASSLTHIEAANHTISTTAEDAIIDLLFASDT